MQRRLFHYVVFIATLLVSVAAPTKAAMTLPESISGLRAAQQRYLPAKELRGYGKVEGQCAEFAAADKSRASVLLIKCDDASRAALTLGKYRSDLASLGGVSNATIAVGHNSLPIVRVEGQGAVAALREDTQVAIVAAQQERDLVVLLAALGVGRQTRFDFVGGDVPMYLDRYDKYGWHFYFNPWSKPQNQPNYDLDDSFQYLSRNGFGMMMPLSLNNIDSTEAVIEYANLAWAIERGRELSIPTFIQAWAIGAAYVDQPPPVRYDVENAAIRGQFLRSRRKWRRISAGGRLVVREGRRPASQLAATHLPPLSPCLESLP